MTALEAGVVDVWRADLDGVGSENGLALLDEAEAARAARFYFEEDRRRYRAARGILRALIGGYLGVDPRTIVFAYAAGGKPSISAPATELRFNVSHSGARGLFAFARGREVGVDVEEGARLGDNLNALARRVFSARERVRWLLRPEPERRAAFLDGWTRKEAILKVSGRGISDGLAEIEVPATTGPEPMAVRRRDEAWTLWDLREFTDCAAAVAVAGAAPARIRRRVVA